MVTITLSSTAFYRLLTLSAVAIAVTGATVPPPIPEDCENLGFGFTQATGPNAYQDVFPSIENIGNNNKKAVGYDDSIAFLCGGDFWSKKGAEVEGNMVIGGDMKISDNGANSLVVAGLGSLIHPTSGGTAITVGGDVRLRKNLAIMQETSAMKTDLVYGGSCSIAGSSSCPKNKSGLASKKVWTNGKVRKDSSLDLSVYYDEIESLKKKASYWATLPANGKTQNKWGELIFKAGDSKKLQVFDLPNGIGNNYWGITFDKSLNGKTCLINMSGKQVYMKAAVMSSVTNGGSKKAGCGKNKFDIRVTQNILWNFHEADDVHIKGSDEVQGSILIPNGNLLFETVGQSGRTLVGGDIVQDKWGSEFHNYEFDPSCGKLPLPDDSVCGAVEITAMEVVSQETPVPMDHSEYTCPEVYLDFNADEFKPGDYIGDLPDHCLTITAIPDPNGSKGYAPGGKARLFNTEDPNQCDSDLETPHSDFGGHGHGCGGGQYLMTKKNGQCKYVLDDNGQKQDNPYKNDKPLGNVLIIQESNKSCQDDSAHGGVIKFEFCQPVAVKMCELLDVDDGPIHTNPTITIFYSDGTTNTHRADSTGDNGVWRSDLHEFDVIKVEVWFHSSGSISVLDYFVCPTTSSTDLPTLSPTTVPPTPEPTTPPPACGNGVLEGDEECDDGNTDSNDGCSSTCTIEYCGNGVLEGDEECDDGNTESNDGCSSICTEEYCGNGKVEGDEECDDGNTDSNDGCSSTCLEEYCGNGIKEENEECDDGNTINGDGCSSTCMEETPEPTKAPTPSPTSPSTTDLPVPVGTPAPLGKCSNYMPLPKLVEQLGTVTDCAFDEGMVEINDQKGDSVTFTIKQTACDQAVVPDFLSISYEKVQGQFTCDAMIDDEAVYGSSQTYTAVCSQGQASVAIYLRNDGTAAAECDTCEAPSYDDVDVAAWYLKLPCKPECIPDDEPECDETEYLVKKSSDVCPYTNESIIKTLRTSDSGIETSIEPSDFIYGIEFDDPVDGNAHTVTFKVNNPMKSESDIYVKYGKKSGILASDPACESMRAQADCSGDTTAITAVCHEYSGVDPFAVVNIYIASQDPFLLTVGEAVTVDKCCHPDDYTTGWGVIEYTIEIKCVCPPTETERKVRHLRG